jgi:hypothetical protein
MDKFKTQYAKILEENIQEKFHDTDRHNDFMNINTKSTDQKQQKKQ